MNPLLIAAAKIAEPSIPVVALTGISLVFLVLALLILIISVQGVIFGKIEKNKRAKAEAEKAAALAKAKDEPKESAAPAKVVPVIEDGIPEEVVAVIAAAVAAMGDGKYTLRSLTRANPSRGKWGAAGASFSTEPF